MEENLAFPMKVKAQLRLRGGKTEEKAVKIVEIDPKSETSLTLRLGITEGKSDRVQYISPARHMSSYCQASTVLPPLGVCLPTAKQARCS
jgi:hypothetical protein